MNLETDSSIVFLDPTYAFGNANTKWQERSDGCLCHLGIKQLLYVPQLFYMNGVGEPVVLAGMVVHDVLFTGEIATVNKVVRHIQ